MVFLVFIIKITKATQFIGKFLFCGSVVQYYTNITTNATTIIIIFTIIIVIYAILTTFHFIYV